MKEGRKTTLMIVAIIAAGILIPLAYQYRQDFKIAKLSLKHDSKKADKRTEGVLVARVGDRHVRLTFVLPVDDRAQQEELLQKMPLIKNDFVMSTERPEVALLLEMRDFDHLREHLLSLVNRRSSKPVSQLYFENFYFD